MDGPGPGAAAHEFARLLRRLRLKAGLTQEELAAAAQLSPRALGNLERSRSAPHRDTVDRLARALDLDDADRDRLRRLARRRAAPGDAVDPAAPAAPGGTAPLGGAGARAGVDAFYRGLAPDGARLFAVIGLHPTTRVAADLVGVAGLVSTETAARLLDRVAGAGLATALGEGEFELSGAAHEYAAARAAELIGPAEAAAARERIAGWYLASAYAADRLIAPHRFRVALAGAAARRTGRGFADRDEAVAWCDRNRECFAPAAELAEHCPDRALVWQIPWALGGYFELRRPEALRLAINQVGLESARRHGDLLGQAAMLQALGTAHYYPRRFDDATACYREAHARWRELGERLGEASALNCLGNVHLETRRLDEALRHYRAALTLFQQVGDRYGEAIALCNIAEAFCELADFKPAAEHARAALPASREARYPRIEIMALCQLARALAATGPRDEAQPRFQEAVALARRTADRHGLAWALTFFGEYLVGCGAPDRAREAWREAVAAFDELGDPHAARMRAKLLALPS